MNWNWLSILSGGLLEAFRTFVDIPLSKEAAKAMPGCIVKRHPSSSDDAELALVLVPPGGGIAPHVHRVPATMIVAHGGAIAIGGDHDGKYVGPGTPIHFAANLPHGFRDAGHEGFCFYSVNGGIQGRDFRLT
jgi:mannose-6-phosphate isomerase-like protein (cupin superfamily)